MVKFTADQLLISSDLKSDSSATPTLDITISVSHFAKYFLTREEVYLQDPVFILGDSGHDLGDLLGLVKHVATIEVFCASSTSPTIT